ncbi:Tryptophanyl-tRNA synthetase [Candidatus Karelsulcia muelleri]|uniref:Tryptophan--tRNA ligase n=1 Tax=Candidatus Karelsulcia muelleri TaxID=336810 RepID=A0A654M3H4_9FLAO|nr:tryptophan--tRNA ligase [Candidatus Karelsulcia muelleri]ALP70136.1 Tryptophanyl-tRNA synthetase [Candidatus Karelsulcia muelleri]QND78382.1 Tryptophan--tRNA ligase [Candidatus Karelsulcia muelleri]
MSIILTGIQSTGIPHIGNVLGVMLPIIEIVNNSLSLESVFILIADLHSLTSLKSNIKDYSYKIASAWLACGLKIYKAILYRQSDITQVTELFWYLNCFFPYRRLKLSHSFKDKKKMNNTGMFTYPILMAADILLFDSNKVYVGKDQLQHIEITRKIAKKINNLIKNILIIPEAKIKKDSMSIPGIDGYKMSKSRKNTINIFYSKKEIKKQIMSIHTTSYNDKNHMIYKIYKILSKKNSFLDFKKKTAYKKAKIELYKYIINRFSYERKKYKFYLKNKKIIKSILYKGTKKASKIANITIKRIRNAIND